MTKELTRFEIAACKRVAANTKSLRTKVKKLNAKIAELEAMKNTYLAEIKMWESPIMEKYGFSADEILNGTYLDAHTENVETTYCEEDYCEAAANESYMAAHNEN